MSTVIEMIKQDHRKVEGLFKQFEQTSDYGIARQICAELTAHALLEEEMLYPLLRNNVDKEEAEHAQEEHDEAKHLIARIQALEPNDPELTSMVKKLEKGISHHVEEEESEMLPHMEKQIAQQLQAIEAQFMERKQQLVQTLVDEAMLSLSPDLSSMTRDELYAKAQQLDITGRSEMSKDELITALNKAK